MISPERSCELMRAYAATHCAAAFREIVVSWSSMVYATALRVSHGQEALAEDVTQIVFFRLATAPEKVRDPHALGAWLHASATGFTLDALRHETRRRRREKNSTHLMRHEPESTAPEFCESPHHLVPVIDGALSKLPPQDSQLLLMRFWQQRDWRSIGQSLGLSDDAAQKRMKRALERLRRILARRGITGTAGALSAVLAITVPRELPAASVLKIISTPLDPTPIGANSTFLPSTVMTAKSKTALAAVLILTAAVPVLYEQHRVADLKEQNQTLRQAKSATALVRATPPDHATSAKRQAPSDLPAPKSDTMTGKEDSLDIDALQHGQMKEKVAVLRERLSLKPEQERVLAKALEYGQIRFKVDPPNVIPIKPTPEDLKKMEDSISAALTADQQKDYLTFREEEKANALEAVANRELSNLQSMMTLSSEQKDQAFEALSEIASREATLPVLEPGGDPEAKAIKEAVQARWADRQEALSSILTSEQMALYRQAGNPFKRGGGG